MLGELAAAAAALSHQSFLALALPPLALFSLPPPRETSLCFLCYQDMPSQDSFSGPVAPAGCPLLPTRFLYCPMAAGPPPTPPPPHPAGRQGHPASRNGYWQPGVTHGREAQARTSHTVGGVLEQSSQASGMKKRGSSRPEARASPRNHPRLALLGLEPRELAHLWHQWLPPPCTSSPTPPSRDLHPAPPIRVRLLLPT